MIYILYGASGVGKKTVCESIVSYFGLQVIDKYTTKKASEDNLRVDKFHKKRFRDDNYLIYMDKQIFDQRRETERYIYDRVRKDNEVVSYMIMKDAIDQAKNDKKNDYLLVCSHSETLGLIEDYVGTTDWGLMFRKILVVGSTRKNATWGEDENRAVYDELIENPAEFYGVIHNKRHDELDVARDRIAKQWTYITQMSPINKKIFFVKPYTVKEDDMALELLKGYEDNVLKKIRDEISKMIQNEINVSYEIQSVKVKPKSTILYQDSNNKLVTREDYIFLKINEKIKEIDEGFSAEIADNGLEKQGELIIDTIIQQINTAGMVIVDLSHNRHNCYYELAIARALNKKVLVIIDHADLDKVPFDEKQYNKFSYEINMKRQGCDSNGENTFVASGITFKAIKGATTFEGAIKEFIEKVKKMYHIQWEQEEGL